jgi:thioredoxin 1
VAAGTLLVACLCAQWCRTCDAYRDTLVAVRDELQGAHPDSSMRFVWVDIEDEAQVIGDLDIEDFPTILVARDDAVLFFGPVLPHSQTIARLVRSVLDASSPASLVDVGADVRALPGLLATHAAL